MHWPRWRHGRSLVFSAVFLRGQSERKRRAQMNRQAKHKRETAIRSEKRKVSGARCAESEVQLILSAGDRPKARTGARPRLTPKWIEEPRHYPNLWAKRGEFLQVARNLPQRQHQPGDRALQPAGPFTLLYIKSSRSLVRSVMGRWRRYGFRGRSMRRRIAGKRRIAARNRLNLCKGFRFAKRPD